MRFQTPLDWRVVPDHRVAVEARPIGRVLPPSQRTAFQCPVDAALIATVDDLCREVPMVVAFIYDGLLFACKPWYAACVVGDSSKRRAVSNRTTDARRAHEYEIVLGDRVQHFVLRSLQQQVLGRRVGYVHCCDGVSHLAEVDRQAVWPIPMPQDESPVARRAQLRSALPPSSSRMPVRDQRTGHVTEW